MDVTAAKRAELVLRESEARYRLLAENVTDIIAQMDLDGVITFATPACERVLGHRPEAMVGRRLLDLMHPDDQAQAQAIVEAYVAAGPERTPITMEYRLRHRDGRWIWVEGQPRVLTDADGAVVALQDAVRDISDRKAAEARQTLMMHELNHRVKNTLATLQSIALQTLNAAETPAAFARAFNARLVALAHSHDVLTDNDWVGAQVRDVVLGQLKPHQSADGARFDLDGPDARVNAKTAVALGMALGELATNAAKYGALSMDEGMVSVRWARDDGTEGPRLRLVWRELGGPPVAPPRRYGFGVRLIEQGLRHELGGAAQLRFEPQGLVCEMSIPFEAEAT
jgi:PAS domain S-box-containing protein